MYINFVVFSFVVQRCAGASATADRSSLLLESFIPASMQIIAHITELMKYDLKPTTVTTTTTVRPTSSHNPGIFSPQKPPGPQVYFAKNYTYEDYVERLMYPSGYNYFDRYRFPVEEERGLENKLEEVDLAFGKNFGDLFRLVNKNEDITDSDLDLQAQQFTQEYDDSDPRFLQLRQKKKPPTRAYVTLLSLYDMLNKESKKLGLNKYNGYSNNVLMQLVESSTGTSADQLRSVLSKIVERKDTKNPQILKRINDLLKDFEDSSSYLNTALRYIKPLPFSL